MEVGWGVITLNVLLSLRPGSMHLASKPGGLVGGSSNACTDGTGGRAGLQRLNRVPWVGTIAVEEVLGVVEDLGVQSTDPAEPPHH